MIFIYDVTYDIEYKQINRIIIDSNVTDMLLIICKGKFGDIYAYNTSCHGYYTYHI